LPHCNIYQQKFDAHYGSSASSIGLDRLHRVRAETLFPAFVLTALLSVCWTALLWDLHRLDLGSGAAELRTSFAESASGMFLMRTTRLTSRSRSSLGICRLAHTHTGGQWPLH